MGKQETLAPFIADDSFLRHVAKKRHIRHDTVSWEAFHDDHPRLSFTFQDANLKTSEGLKHYQLYKALPSDDLPGICKLTFYDLTESLRPPLPPCPAPEPDDPEYGHLHCVTERPNDQEHKEQMAKLATRNGVLLEFIRKGKRQRQPRCSFPPGAPPQ